MFSIFQIKKSRPIKREELYEDFLNSIDNLSRRRLKSIDMAIAVVGSIFNQEGFVLSEVECVGPKIKIKRNQFGFYVDETNSLNSKDDYLSYQYGLKFLNKNKKRFNNVHKLLCEKECIMRGLFNAKEQDKEKLINLALELGYGSKRDNEIYEEEYLH